MFCLDRLIERRDRARLISELAFMRLNANKETTELIRVHARVGVGEPACEERVVLQGDDPALP